VLVMALISVLGPLLLYLQFAQGKYTLLQFQGSYLLGFLMYFGFGMIVLAIHEIGHGLAVKHAGHTTNRGGFLIYYGFLAAFVDTTDVWMAPRRITLTKVNRQATGA
jgi:putative peptide zinc metalloprotease protein